MQNTERKDGQGAGLEWPLVCYMYFNVVGLRVRNAGLVLITIYEHPIREEAMKISEFAVFRSIKVDQFQQYCLVTPRGEVYPWKVEGCA